MILNIKKRVGCPARVRHLDGEMMGQRMRGLPVEQANRLYEIARDTLRQEVDAERPRGYQNRKVAEKCTYPGCDDPPCEDCNECPTHRAQSKERRHAYRVKQRRMWERRKLCLRCGDRRRPGSKWCSLCLARAGKLERDKQRDKSDEGSKWVERMEQSPDGVMRARRRFVGRGKRGRHSNQSLDMQDLDDARKCFAAGADLLAACDTDAIKALPKVQRDDEKQRALRELERAADWIEEILVRNGAKSRVEDDSADDE